MTETALEEAIENIRIATVQLYEVVTAFCGEHTRILGGTWAS